MQSSSDTPAIPPQMEGSLSKDQPWRSFPATPNLLQYVSNGNHYGRTKIGGKIIRVSLKTDVWTTAKLRLINFLQKHQEARTRVEPPTFSEAVDLFVRGLQANARIKQRTKGYRLLCLLKIQRTWPGLPSMRMDKITPLACGEWAASLAPVIANHYFNNTIATLRQVLDVGIRFHKENGGNPLENPMAEVKRVRVKQKELKLPEPSQFKALIEAIRRNLGAYGSRTADLVEFLAYSGMRVFSEAEWVTWDDIDWSRKEIIVRRHPDTGTKNSLVRRIPIISDMELLLKRMQQERPCASGGRLLQVRECRISLV